MKLEADVRSLIAQLQATLAGSSEGRGVEGHADGAKADGSGIGSGMDPIDQSLAQWPQAGIKPGRPSLEPTGQGGGNGRRAPLEGVTGRGSGTLAGLAGSNPAPGTTGCDDWHEQYTARMAEALRKQAIRTARYKRKLWREAEAAREERRSGKTYGSDAEGRDPFRGHIPD